jgi:glutamine phosphoribosylpyrophosphate amidotransferase
MCSVIGAIIKDPTKDDFNMIRRVFHESRIRGMHATGMSVLYNNKIMTFKEPVPADEFRHLDDLEEMVNVDNILYLIGHCRYSTSDLEYNQPLSNEKKSIVHNGVITQELPENWDVLYPYVFETKNDSELVLHSDDPLREFPDASMAVCELYDDGRLRFYRNGKRPLYLTNLSNGSIITSTADVPKRAEVVGVPINLLMNHYNTFDSELTLMIERVDVPMEIDYQHEFS